MSQARNQRAEGGKLSNHLAVFPFLPVLHNLKFRQANCSACHLVHAGFLVELFFNPKDGGKMFL
jgi:hypothetical protein